MIQYLKARLLEKSTWLAIGAAVLSAATLAHPWNYIFFGVGVIGALVPTKRKPCGDE